MGSTGVASSHAVQSPQEGEEEEEEEEDEDEDDEDEEGTTEDALVVC